jgi:Phytanoyl-CoA dioxygenase (PhyH)
VLVVAQRRSSRVSARFTHAQIDTWRRDGGVLIEGFFSAAEVASVQADFESVFGPSSGAARALVKKKTGEIGKFNPAQFTTFDAIPFDCSPALNLIGVHPALIEFAKAALDCSDVHLYQCQAWAKFTGAADYDQPFHCDYVNHTLTAPADDAALNSVTILCYFSDVTEAHGPMHYVRRSDSAAVAPVEATLGNDASLQPRLQAFERTSAAPAGSIFPYAIDVFHRGTNMTAPHGHRYAVMACYKRAGNDAIGYHAWPFHHTKPWHHVFDHASTEQLACFGVPRPGDPFWTETTLARAQARYPGWDLNPYRAALRRRVSS